MPLIKVVILLCIGIILGQQTSLFDHLSLVEILSWNIVLVCISTILNFRNRVLSTFFIAFSIIIFGALLIHSRKVKNIPTHFSSHLGNNSALIIQIESIKETSKNIQCISKVNFVFSTLDSLTPVVGKLLVYLPKDSISKFYIGDELILKNNIYGVFENKNPEAFDYKSFLESKNIFHQNYAFEGSYLKINDANLNCIKQITSEAKEYIVETLNRHINNKENLSIVKAMILGDKSEIDDNTYLSFSETGAIHVLAVSGLHVGIVAGIILGLLKYIDRINRLRHLKYPLCLIAVWFYVLLTGSAPPSVRAAIMFSTIFMAPIVKRYTNTYNSIGAAAFIILLHNPLQLFTISFQFSFLALISIIFFYPILDSIIFFRSKILKWFWSLIILSISAQILLTPLSIYYFHKFPSYFWLSGIIAVPAAGLILSIGFSLIISSLLPFLSTIETLIGSLLNLILEALKYSINIIHKFPFSIIDNIWITKPIILFTYIGLTLLMIGIIKKNAKFFYLSLIAIIIQIGMHIENKTSQWNENKIIVYNIHKNSLIEFISQGTRRYLLKQLDNEKAESWNCNNYRKSCYVFKEVKPNQSLHQKEIPLKLKIEDKLIFIDPDSESMLNSRSNEIDLLIVTQNSNQKFKELKWALNAKQIVIDGSITYEKEELLQYLKEKKIKFHDTSKDGAFIYKINS